MDAKVTSDKTERVITVELRGVDDLREIDAQEAAEDYLYDRKELNGYGGKWYATDCKRVNYNVVEVWFKEDDDEH